MHPARIEVPYNGQSFFIDIADGKMVNLNRIYEISGASSGKDPRRWIGLESTKILIKSIDVVKSDILKTKRGGAKQISDNKKPAGAGYWVNIGSSGRKSISGGPGYEFVEFIAKSLNVNAGDIYKTHGAGSIGLGRLLRALTCLILIKTEMPS